MGEDRFLVYKAKVAEIADMIRSKHPQDLWYYALKYECNLLALRGGLNKDDDDDVKFFRSQMPHCPHCIMHNMEFHIVLLLFGTRTVDSIQPEEVYKHVWNCTMKTFDYWREINAKERRQGLRPEQLITSVEDFTKMVETYAKQT